MPFCMRCGAKLEDGDKFCMRCGTRMDEARPVRPRPERSRPAQDPEDEQMKMPVWIPTDNKREEIPENDGDAAAESDRIADVPDPNGTFIPAQPVQAPEAGYVPPQPTQNPYAGYVPPQTAQNAYGNPAQPVWVQPGYMPAYTQPRPQLKSKAGGIVMTVIGAILLATALVFLLEGVVWAALGNYVPDELLVFFFVGAFLFLTGGVLLLIFGIVALKKTHTYNERVLRGESPYEAQGPQLKSKAGGIVMIVFGLLLLIPALLFGLMLFLRAVRYSFQFHFGRVELLVLIGLITVLCGGALLLLFGIRAMKKAKAYNERAEAEYERKYRDHQTPRNAVY